MCIPGTYAIGNARETCSDLHSQRIMIYSENECTEALELLDIQTSNPPKSSRGTYMPAGCSYVPSDNNQQYFNDNFDHMENEQQNIPICVCPGNVW